MPLTSLPWTSLPWTSLPPTSLPPTSLPPTSPLPTSGRSLPHPVVASTDVASLSANRRTPLAQCAYGCA
ncbi:hypothetical protein DEH69_29445 [Streptomyces sp. PT12]|nr:hypothetical protein DEH69_29445 [Streptomyces sp. PT12]